LRQREAVILARHFDLGERQSFVRFRKDVHLPMSIVMKNAVAGFFENVTGGEQKITFLADGNFVLIFLFSEA
jgi:hypothetical protein